MVKPGEPAFDAGLEELLASVFPGSRLDAMARLTGGVSADVYRLDLDDRDGSRVSAVLRVHGASHSGHDAALEHAILEAAGDAGLPVAAPLAMDAAGTVLGRPCLLIAHINGSTAIPSDRRDDRLDAMAAMLARIHKTSLEDFPLLPARNDPLPELFDFLVDPAEADAWRARLSHLGDTAYAGPPVLLHGDLWPENLIWKDDRIAAVLDWEDAAVGDPLSDVACTCLEVRYIFGRDGMDTFRNAYAHRTAIDPARLTLWLAYVSAGALRYMGDWGLPAGREAHMRAEALATLAEAAEALSA